MKTTSINKSAERIVLEKPAVSGGDTLVCRFQCTPGIAQTFRSDVFVATYDSADLAGVPYSLLAIPLLANVAPVAWALNATVRVPSVDRVFFGALQKVRESLQAMFPHIPWSGEILPDRLEKPVKYRADRPALLFSGGVDSIASYLAHRSEDPLLVTALGKAPFGELGEAVKAQLGTCREFATRHKARLTPVETNLNRLLNPQSLPFGAGWWQKVQHGLAFLGLCAPLSPGEGLHTVYLAATHSASFGLPWGSHPSVDNQVAWSSTKAVHDGYHLTRQQKVALIAEHIRTEDPELKIQICRRGPGYGNCSRCGKCCRTMIGLAIEGIDPNLHGFLFDAETLVHIRKQLAARAFLRSFNNRFMWTDIQRRLPDSPTLEVPGLAGFFRWLREFQIGE